MELELYFVVNFWGVFAQLLMNYAERSCDSNSCWQASKYAYTLLISGSGMKLMFLWSQNNLLLFYCLFSPCFVKRAFFLKKK